MALTLPAHNWRPRRDQLKLWSYLENGGKRAIEIAHRRWGKDEIALHRTAVAMVERTGTYWHMLPEAAQARKAIWTAINPHTQRRRIDEVFPEELRANTNDTEMFIRLRNGSTWQVVGSDNYNSLVGSPPIGVVFSEWALAHPAAWAYLRPILAENGGWSVFITTPRGRNHAYEMYQAANMPGSGWFAERLTAHDTGVFTPEQLENERREYVDQFGLDVGEALYRQEYECDWSAAILGSYWGRELADAERQGRIGPAEWRQDAPVYTAWDLGVGDSTAIWWFQVVGSTLGILDYYESHGVGLDHYAAIIKAKPYRSKVAFVPQDAKVREFTATTQQGEAKTRVQTMMEMGLNPKLVPAHKLGDGINAVRKTLPHCHFDAAKCAKGLEALRSYHAEWDEKSRTFRDTPKHDSSSHAADAFRYLSMVWRLPKPEEKPTPKGRMLHEMTWNDLMAATKNRRESRI